MAGVSEESRDRRRSFSSAERVALFLAADGRCSSCDGELEPGWHGDHVEPWSMGGPTDVINGQALCPSCNLKKGSSVTNDSGLRDWQADALDRYVRRNGGKDGNFLVVATPGAGKTTLALTTARNLIERGTIDNIVVIVPTSHLRRQWAEAAARMGIKIDHTFENGNGVVSSTFDGVATTYQGVASSPLVWRRIAGRKSTLVIFDEIHHAGDGENLVWGDALKEAFEPAVRRLLLSGTPFRTDRKPIPFVAYDKNRRAVHDYDYDYGKALADGGVVRPVVFPAWDGKSRWRRSGEMAITEVDLSDADKAEIPPALKAALDPEGEWIPSVLHKANHDLMTMREDTPDAGGLVVASDQFHANAYAKILSRICGHEVPVAISDEPNSSGIIKEFARGSAPWIVAVQMIAEGVDIPRLAVGVYASRIRTQMFFIQVVGRFVRLRGEEDYTTARLFIPSIGILLRYAQDIEKTVDAVLAEEEEKVRADQTDEGEGGTETLLPAYETVGSSIAVHHATIASGTSLTPEHLETARREKARIGAAVASVTVEQMAAILTSLGHFNTDTIPTPRSPQPEAPLVGDQMKDLRKVIHRRVSLLARITGQDYMEINAALNKNLNNRVKSATLEELQERLRTLDEAIKKEGK
ncbi:DEAD/DEAH box helicase family protein [Kitasatospora purpeofusca]|uniref:DEAD/DEAH box helicase family protein n=1 Tax=Kitasatospora purpeofusca TaxID=67352 RepID=UPI0033C9C916